MPVFGDLKSGDSLFCVTFLHQHHPMSPMITNKLKPMKSLEY